MSLQQLIYCLTIPSVLWSVVRAGDVRIAPQYTEVAGKIEDQPFFLPGQSLTLTCTTDKPDAVLSWTQYLRGSSEQASLVVRGISGNSVIFNPLHAKHGGQYNCSDGDSFTSFYVNVLDKESLVPTHITTNGTLMLLHLQCLQRFGREFPLIWTRNVNGQTIVLNDAPHEDKNFTVNTDHKEKFLHALAVRSREGRYPLKTGEYVCELNTTGTNIILREPIRRTVVYESTPDVKMDGKARSQNAIQGDVFRMTCIYTGASGSGEDDRVKWTSNGSVANSWKTLVDYNDTLSLCPGELQDPDRRCLLNNPRFTLTRDRRIENASSRYERTSVLEIKDVQDGDRNQYFCFVRNEHGQNNATAFVRVKDRWGALWPFLGILGELVFLALIICICERRRSKYKAPEEEEETKPLTEPNHQASGATPAVAAASSVRNRK